MSWYKFRHGLPRDPRLAVVARRAGLKLAEILGFWVALHDHACRQMPRGSLGGLDSEQMSVTLDIEPARIDAALRTCKKKGLITADNRLTEWTAQQTTSTARVRAFRERQAAQAAPPAHHPDDPDEIRRRRERLSRTKRKENRV